MNSERQKQHVLIVGGNGGIGSCLSEYFYKNGVLVSKITRKSSKSGGLFLDLEADLSDFAQVEQVLRTIQKEKTLIHSVIFAAGVVRDHSLIKMTEEEWDQVEWVNLKSVWQLMQGLAPLIKQAGGGHFVHIGSIVGLTGRFGQANYAAAKAGLIALSKSAAQEFGADNIRSNVIVPGFLKTKMTAHLKESQIEKIKSDNVLGRIGTLEEVAEFIYFLCSTQHISGQVFNLDSRILPTF